MKNGPEFRIIGGASEEVKREAKESMEEKFFKHFDSLSPQERGELEKFEYPKSQKELALINFANLETNRLMMEAGVEAYDVPAENYHIIPPELYSKAARSTSDASTHYIQQGILFNAKNFRDAPLYFGSVAFHETLHIKAHTALQVEEEGTKIGKTLYRKGVGVAALQKHGFHGKLHEHFVGLHEAIVAETQKRATGRLLALPELEKEKEWLGSEEALKMKRELAERKEIPESEIMWVEEKDESGWRTFAYPVHREVLNYVCGEIQKQFADKYEDADEVYKVFLKAHFTGQLLPIARLVEKTFGEGSFRLLGNMDGEKMNAVLHLESLKKARARQTRK